MVLFVGNEEAEMVGFNSQIIFGVHSMWNGLVLDLSIIRTMNWMT